MPLTDFQRHLASLLAHQRTPDSHLAGGAALHFAPQSRRFSNDLDFFHDSVERVSEAFADDRALLEADGCRVLVEMSHPGYVRASVHKGDEATKIEWAHDSAWRFMPPIYVPGAGFQLHPVDLATNKVLALAGRNEARDLLDVLDLHATMLSLGALCWAAVGKDPGFTPLSLLELLRRRGKFHAEDFRKLHTVEPVDLVELKTAWLAALDQAQILIDELPPQDIGCLYYSTTEQTFVAPRVANGVMPSDAVRHFGAPGGVLPQLYAGDALAAACQATAPPSGR